MLLQGFVNLVLGTPQGMAGRGFLVFYGFEQT
jgi:hypothetical protein